MCSCGFGASSQVKRTNKKKGQISKEDHHLYQRLQPFIIKHKISAFFWADNDERSKQCRLKLYSFIIGSLIQKIVFQLQSIQESFDFFVIHICSKNYRFCFKSNFLSDYLGKRETIKIKKYTQRK